MIRREFFKTGGALVVGFSLRDSLVAQNQGAQERGTKAGPPDAKQVDTWLAIHADNSATVYIGFAELGQGASTALLQIAAEELDLDMSQIKTVRLDTNVTPNQGGTYSSASINRGGPQIRTAAAEARLALLKLASAKLNTPPERLTVEKGVVSGSGKSVTYGELVGDKPFNVAFSGNAPVKKTTEYKIVGTSYPRNDTPAKVSAQYTYMQYVRVPGMLHGRVVRPRGQRMYGAGAKIMSVDEASIRAIPGARVVRKNDFLGVVAENEWDAIRAAQQLKVVWETPPALPGNAGLYEHMRAAKTDENIVLERGNVTTGFGGAAHTASHTCLGPYQAHVPFGPNCAVADVKADSALVMCSTQDVYGTRNSLSRLLGMPVDKIRVQYYEGSGTYGHSCYDDVAQAAVLLSQLAGKPVRLQFMRWDEHGWDNYGPGHVGEVRAAADANGKIVAYEYQGWQHGWINTETSAQLTGVPPSEWPGAGTGVQGVNRLTCGGMYDIPNLRLVNHKLPVTSYLKAGWLRSPLDLSFAFASEQAIDQLAYLTGADPYEFRRSQHDRHALVGRAERRSASREVDASQGGGEFVASQHRDGTRNRRRHAPHVARGRSRRDRGQQRNRPRGGETPLRRDRFRPGGEPGFRRKPDHGAVGADRQPHVQRGSEVRSDRRHQSRLVELSHPAVRRMSGGHRRRRAAAG